MSVICMQQHQIKYEVVLLLQGKTGIRKTFDGSYNYANFWHSQLVQKRSKRRLWDQDLSVGNACVGFSP